MQAQPQSNLAARIPPASPPASPASSPTPLLPTSRTTPSLANTLGLAHDAGNLLAALGLYCDLLSVPGVLRPEHQHYATELRLISDRSSKLIQRLLVAPDATAPDASQPTGAAPVSLPPALLRRRDTRSCDAITPTPNPASTLLSLAPVLRRIAAGAASVSVTCPASLPLLDFPSEIIERITVNLVRNAAEAIRIHRATTQPSTPPPPPGKIQLTLSVVAGRLQLTVADNGPGMPPAVVAAYLRPTRLPHGASRGLGHRIVHELATSTHGQLSIRVRPGHGTLFCLTWPIPSSALDQRDGPDTSSLPSLMTA